VFIGLFLSHTNHSFLNSVFDFKVQKILTARKISQDISLFFRLPHIESDEPPFLQEISSIDLNVHAIL
jgi:hypothetical protein